MFKIQNISASYCNHQVLHNMMSTVNSGKDLALINPNGAGKSTIIRAARHGSLHMTCPHERPLVLPESS